MITKSGERRIITFSITSLICCFIRNFLFNKIFSFEIFDLHDEHSSKLNFSSSVKTRSKKNTQNSRTRLFENRLTLYPGLKVNWSFNFSCKVFPLMFCVIWNQRSKLKDKQGIQKTPPKSYKTEIKLLANRGLAKSDFEQPGSEFLLFHCWMQTLISCLKLNYCE